MSEILDRASVLKPEIKHQADKAAEQKSAELIRHQELVQLSTKRAVEFVDLMKKCGIKPDIEDLYMNFGDNWDTDWRPIDKSGWTIRHPVDVLKGEKYIPGLVITEDACLFRHEGVARCGGELNGKNLVYNFQDHRGEYPWQQEAEMIFSDDFGLDMLATAAVNLGAIG
jgi:hypothetical protein